MRRKNRIRTIHSSLAIEHNYLSLEQVTAILNGDILIHMAPPARFVPEHIQNLFAWYRQTKLHPLIKSAIFHYEFEFIHPFADGNGRMGQMWHSLLLGQWKEMFLWLPIEELIQSRQKEYYATLGIADKKADCSEFIELMLEIIRDSLNDLALSQSNTDQVSDQDTDQVSDQDKAPIQRLLSVLGDKELSATEIMERLGLSHRPTFRKNYLTPALEKKMIERTIPDKPNSRNQKYRKC